MPPEAEPKERITVSLPLSLRREIEIRADYAGQTLSVWVERACKGYMEQHPQKRDA